MIRVARENHALARKVIRHSSIMQGGKSPFMGPHSSVGRGVPGSERVSSELQKD